MAAKQKLSTADLEKRLKAAEAKLKRIAKIAETPEWFDSPCARAVAKALK
jgi:hypothetical protein